MVDLLNRFTREELWTRHNLKKNSRSEACCVHTYPKHCTDNHTMFQFSYDYNTALPTKFEEVAVVVHYAVGDLNSIFTKAFLQILYDLNK